jgi:hypothetical protein
MCCAVMTACVTRNAEIGGAHCIGMNPRSAIRSDVDDAATMAAARDARAEAQQIVGDDFAARVLEPSPPAVRDGEWFADDPVAADVPPGRPVVSPVPGTDLTWDEWLRDHPDHEEWAAARWLRAHRRLPHPPAALVETRLALHRLAVYVVSPARRRANGKIALRWTFRGFGTPFFDDDEQVRVAGMNLVRQRGGTTQVAPMRTLKEAAALALDGPPDSAWAESFDVPPASDPDDELRIDDAAAAFLGDWYGFAWSVLEELRADRESIETTRVQLWPEHFDAAFDCCPGDRRATFGASPGDAAIELPYLYVLPANFENAPRSDCWSAETFNGGVLPLMELVDAPDQRAATLTFFRRCRDVLRGERS